MIRTGKRKQVSPVAERPRESALAFTLLCAAMFVNLILAFLHARGLPASSGIVIAVQALVTACALPAFFSRNSRFGAASLFALGFVLLSAIATNAINPFNPKTIYDSMLIPVYIAVGMSAGSTPSKWMNNLLFFVFGIALVEIFIPSIYTGLFNPAGYLSSTREWIGGQHANAAANAGLYAGAYRAGGSLFAIADHRVAGPFLEPISLGYFAFLMSTYYAGIHRGSLRLRVAAIVICLFLALVADSRIPTVLIVLSTLFLGLRMRLPEIVLWLAFPVIMLVVYLTYLAHPAFLFGDTFYRLDVTFAAIGSVGIGEVLAGMMPLGQIGDSGVLYMLRCVGLLGFPVAIWLYSGAFNRRQNTNVAFFVAISLHLTISLLFGGASLSIKTASLLGYLVGLAAQSGARGRNSKMPNISPPADGRDGVATSPEFSNT